MPRATVLVAEVGARPSPMHVHDDTGVSISSCLCLHVLVPLRILLCGL